MFNIQLLSYHLIPLLTNVLFILQCTHLLWKANLKLCLIFQNLHHFLLVTQWRLFELLASFMNFLLVHLYQILLSLLTSLDEKELCDWVDKLICETWSVFVASLVFAKPISVVLSHNCFINMGPSDTHCQTFPWTK